MSFAPYLAFDGACREAMTRYAEIFGATDLHIMTADDAPADAMGSFPNGRVMHSQLSLDGTSLMAADMASRAGSAEGRGDCVCYTAPSSARGAAVFAALAEGGKADMPFAPTFFSAGFGIVTDRFGTNWMITTAMGAS
jgi:PhnB protein